MGCADSTDDRPLEEEGANEGAALKSEKTSLNWSKGKKLALPKGASFGAPFINNDKISFLTSVEQNAGVISYDLKADEWGENASVTYEAGSLDIIASGYTFHAKSNTLHFIRDNSEVLSLDLSTNTLKSTATVSSSDENQVLIHSLKGKVYILGMESEESKSENDFVYVPYDENMQGVGEEAVTTTVTLDGKDYIFVCGGIKVTAATKAATGIKAPHEELWVLNVEEGTWAKQHMNRNVTGCGIINYNNEYLLAFGGLGVDKSQQMKGSKEINALDLKAEQWFRLKARLPFKGRCFAFYPEGSNVVRLFSWSGKHLTAQLDDIVHNASRDELKFAVSTWNEQGKTVLPTKAASVKSMGPKMDEESDSD